MNNSTKRKNDLLGEPYGTANAKLKKAILFGLLQELEKDVCFQCGNKIENISELSIEHKEPWMSSKNPITSFYDLTNISFSHLSCNIGAAERKQGHRDETPHGHWRYSQGCRCETCVSVMKDYYNNRNKTEERKKYNREYQKSRYHSDEKFRNYFLEKGRKKSDNTGG